MSNVNSSAESKVEVVFQRASAILNVTLLSIAALFLGSLLSSAVNPSSTTTMNAEPTVGLMAGIAASFVGMALGGLVYLVATGRGIEYIRVAKPTRTTAKHIGIGVGLSLGMLFTFNIVVAVTGIPVAQGWVTSTIGENLKIALLFIGIVFLFNAPAEEFLFRGIVQERLGETFSPWSSIILTGALFSVFHVPPYLMTATVTETIAPTFIVFGGALVFGWLYNYSDNLLVPIVAHAIFNAVQLGVYIITIVA